MCGSFAAQISIQVQKNGTNANYLTDHCYVYGNTVLDRHSTILSSIYLLLCPSFTILSSGGPCKWRLYQSVVFFTEPTQETTLHTLFFLSSLLHIAFLPTFNHESSANKPQQFVHEKDAQKQHQQYTETSKPRTSD